MHILVVNDDGPPSPHSSPYVHSLVRELQAAGHVVSVCLPHTQRSWIGKAHMIGQTVKPLYYRPPPPSRPAAGLTPAEPVDSENDNDARHGTTHTRPSTHPGVEEWILVDGTPASCVQIGLYHFFQDRGPVDLVVSGPNYGRNTTAVFALSSGTLGGALEAAVCKRRAIALSYAFFSRNHDAEIIAKASRRGVKVIEALWKAWPEDGSVDLYSVNVPLLEKLEEEKVLFTGMLQNYWGAGSCFTEVDGSVDGEEEDEERIREGEAKAEEDGGQREKGPKPHTHKHFKWSPRFTDVYKSVEEAPPGNDGWAVKEGFTSVTPLKANFFQAGTSLHGSELQLGNSTAAAQERPAADMAPSKLQAKLSIRARSTVDVGANPGSVASPSSSSVPHFYALINYEDPYVQPLILSAMDSLFPKGSWTLLTPPAPSSATTKNDNADDSQAISLPSLLPAVSSSLPAEKSKETKIIQISPYESIDFSYATARDNSRSCLINSYMIRKALIRKHFLSATIENWVAKHPASVLGSHVKRSEAFEVDFAEFLDDALVEAWDLRGSLERNERVLAGLGGCEGGETGIGDRDGDSGEGVAELEGGEGDGHGENEEKSLEWWILKPSMSDRGQGIRLFSTMEQLQGIFDEWEPEEEDDEDEDDDEDGDSDSGGARDGDADGEEDGKDHIMASHLRHFVAQPYIHPPLLLPELDNRKFHIRVYVLAVGSMRVYIYRDMLALFAAKPYQPPSAVAREGGGSEEGGLEIDLDAHLTNTCLQGDDTAAKANSVRRFWDLPLGRDTADSIFEQICAVTGEVFEAAARGMMVHFQPLACAFEVYGLDFLVDAAGTAWLLEVNAFPDFKQTGELKGIVAGFWTGVLRLAAVPFVTGSDPVADEGDDGMVLVRGIDLGRRWGS